MKKVEITSLVILLIGFTFKFLHYPGGSILTIIPLFMLSILYTSFSWTMFKEKSKNEDVSSDQTNEVSVVILHIFIGISLGATIMGLMFKLMEWPGASFMLFVGAPLLILLGVIELLKNGIRTPNYNFNPALVRIVPVLLLAFGLSMIPRDTFLNWKYPFHPEYVEAVLNAEQNPDNLELQKKKEDQWNKMMNAMDGGRR